MRDYLFKSFPKRTGGTVQACFYRCHICGMDITSQYELFPEQPFTERMKRDLLTTLSINIGEHMLDHAKDMHESAMKAWPIIVAEYRPMTEMSLWRRIKHVFYPHRSFIAFSRMRVTVPLVGREYNE